MARETAERMISWGECIGTRLCYCVMHLYRCYTVSFLFSLNVWGIDVQNGCTSKVSCKILFG